MHVAITGASGLIGRALTRHLRGAGDRITRLVRRPPDAPDEVRWDPEGAGLDPAALAGVDAVVHLAGEGIASSRWSPEQRRRIRESRTRGTAHVARAIAATDHLPVLVVASGIGYYGDRGDDVLTEESRPGEGFLADVCVAWEAAADPARDAGARVVHVRTGVVQSCDGGALPRLLPLFRLGLGGRLGSGRQYLSWVTLDDVVGIYAHALATAPLFGAVNATAPNPVTNAEYTKTLAQVLGRPAFLAVPRAAPRLVVGAMADELLFFSQRVVPEQAQATGYEFRHVNLAEGLCDTIEAAR